MQMLQWSWCCFAVCNSLIKLLHDLNDRTWLKNSSASLNTELFNAFELGQNVKIKCTIVETESIYSLCCQNLSDDSPPKDGADDVCSDTKQFLFLTF